MGTRFVASTESTAHPLYKQALIAAKPDDTIYTNCFDVGWPFAMHRVLRNSTLDAWEAAGCPAAPARPGEGDIVMQSPTGGLVRYHNDQPKEESRGRHIGGLPLCRNWRWSHLQRPPRRRNRLVAVGRGARPVEGIARIVIPRNLPSSAQAEDPCRPRRKMDGPVSWTMTGIGV